MVYIKKWIYSVINNNNVVNAVSDIWKKQADLPISENLSQQTIWIS